MTRAFFSFSTITVMVTTFVMMTTMIGTARADDIFELATNDNIQFANNYSNYLPIFVPTVRQFGTPFASLVKGWIQVTGLTSADIYDLKFKMQIKLKDECTKKQDYCSGTVTVMSIARESGNVLGTCIGRDYISRDHYYGSPTAFCTFSGDNLGTMGEIGFYINANIPFDTDNGSLVFAVSVTKKA